MKLRMQKKQKLILEIGIALICTILFFGALNTVAVTCKTPILTTEGLLNTTVTIAYYGYNATEGEWHWIVARTYNVSDIATYYDGWLYLSIPYDVSATYDDYSVAFIEFHTNYTHKQLVEMGLNRIEFAVKFDGAVDRDKDGKVIFKFGIVKKVEHPDWWSIYNPYMYEGNATATSVDFNGTLSMDTVSYLYWVTENNIQNAEAAIGLVGSGTNIKAKTVMLKINMYAISEKPVLKAFSEPVYSVLAGLWGLIIGLWRRVKSLVASAFSGFSLSFLFTGLIGDAVTATIITVVLLTVFAFVFHKKR